MLLFTRLAALATFSAIINPVLSQTTSSCDPVKGETCSADTALDGSVTIDFTSGASDQFTSSGGTPTYDSDGVKLTISEEGDAPTLTSDWYIMFGKYSIVMKAAPGTGIVSSLVLLSDDLDEIDWEFLGGRDNEVQSNYFRKGSDSGSTSAVLTVDDTQETWHTYTLEWTSTEIVWSIDGTAAEVITAAAAGDYYPQTPMRLKIGIWAGGDPDNAAGTIAWAGGETDYSDGPFTMLVQSVTAEDYSSGTSFSYSGDSGDWEDIDSSGGTISGGPSSVNTAPAVTSTASGAVAWDGTHRTTSSASTPGLDGWTLATASAEATSSNALSYESAASTTPLSTSLTASSSHSSSVSPQDSCSISGGETTTLYDNQGFLTTVVVPTGSRYNEQGSLITLASNCASSISTQMSATSTNTATTSSGGVISAQEETVSTSASQTPSSSTTTATTSTATATTAADSSDASRNSRIVASVAVLGLGLIAAMGMM